MPLPGLDLSPHDSEEPEDTPKVGDGTLKEEWGRETQEGGDAEELRLPWD